MKTVALAILIATCTLGQNSPACGPTGVKFKVVADKLQHPMPVPESGRALLYVLGDGNLGVDGKWVGAVDQTYFFMELDPGEHRLCAELSIRHPVPLIVFPLIKMERVSAHSLLAKAGETYYFYARFNYRDVSLTLDQLDPDEGARLLSLAKFSTSSPK